MKKATKLHNNIKQLRIKRDLSSGELADMVGTSRPHMSRLENGKSPLDADWILKISAALKVSTSEVADVQFNKRLSSLQDDTMVGSVLGWMLEANDQLKAKLTNEELSKWASYVFKKASAHSLNAQYMRDLTFTVVEVIKLSRK